MTKAERIAEEDLMQRALKELAIGRKFTETEIGKYLPRLANPDDFLLDLRTMKLIQARQMRIRRWLQKRAQDPQGDVWQHLPDRTIHYLTWSRKHEKRTS